MAFMPASKLSSGVSSDNILLRLVQNAALGRISGLDYAGELSPSESFAYISENPSVVVDVRTTPEWQFVGVPDLSSTPSRLLTLSWKLYPSFIDNPKFIADLLAETSITVDTPLFFICRSGGRSLDAAVATTAEGYHYCFNITGGFEGELDKDGHRAMASGWKHSNLPWRQS